MIEETSLDTRSESENTSEPEIANNAAEAFVAEAQDVAQESGEAAKV